MALLQFLNILLLLIDLGGIVVSNHLEQLRHLSSPIAGCRQEQVGHVPSASTFLCYNCETKPPPPLLNQTTSPRIHIHPELVHYVSILPVVCHLLLAVCYVLCVNCSDCVVRYVSGSKAMPPVYSVVDLSEPERGKKER